VNDRKAFDRWIRRSPEHIAAYLEVAAVWSDPAAHDAKKQWDADALIAQARSAPNNIVPLLGDRGPVVSEPSDSISPVVLKPNKNAPSMTERTMDIRRKLLKGPSLAASFVLLVIGVISWHQTQGSTYRTEIGEQRSIRLEDGSTVDMNSRTVIRVKYRNHRRNVDIRQGQALFKVVADSNRPFVVESNGTTVRAVGTQFDVYRKALGMVVTVVEGSVMVRPRGIASGPESGLLLAADEQMSVMPNVVPHVEKGAAATATAWTRGKIVFSRASLVEVAEEFNRYSTRRLVIEDPAADDFHLSGVFSSSDPTSIVNFLRMRAELDVTDSATEIRIRKKSN